MRSRPRLERTTAADVVGDHEANVEALGGGLDGGTGATLLIVQQFPPWHTKRPVMIGPVILLSIVANL
jgi:hypothetical protein